MIGRKNREEGARSSKAEASSKVEYLSRWQVAIGSVVLIGTLVVLNVWMYQHYIVDGHIEAAFAKLGIRASVYVIGPVLIVGLLFHSLRLLIFNIPVPRFPEDQRAMQREKKNSND